MPGVDTSVSVLDNRVASEGAHMRESGHRVVVVGSSFAGLTGALELRRRLGDDAQITVIDRRDHFTFIPSLIWIPFGHREPDDVTFPLSPVYASQNIAFMCADVIEFDIYGRRVRLRDGRSVPYDRLLIATGPELAFDAVPGLGPDAAGCDQSVCNLEHAMGARAAWSAFLEDPGPVVVGTAQGGSYFGASYEFLLNARHQLDGAGLEEIPVTYITPEPFLGHFGLNGVGDSADVISELFASLGIEGIPNSAIRESRPGEIELEGGRVLAAEYSMIIPPLRGVAPVRSHPTLSDEAGWIPVNDEYRHVDHREIFAAGVDIAVSPPAKTLVPAGVPKTGYMSEHMAKIAAHNIAADLTGGTHRRVPFDEIGAIAVLDGGDRGLVLKTDHVIGEAEHPHLIAGPQAHWAKVAFEKYFMATRRRGFVGP